MDDPKLNPYQSPTGIESKESQVDPREPMTLAELQARVVQLEKQLKDSWFLGPLWKRSVAVFLHFFLAYAVLGLVAGGIMMLIGLAFAAFGIDIFAVAL